MLWCSAFDPRQTRTCTHSKVTTGVHVYSADLQTCLICIACRIPRAQPFNTESFITRQDPTGKAGVLLLMLCDGIFSHMASVMAQGPFERKAVARSCPRCSDLRLYAHVCVVSPSREDHLHRNKCSASDWATGLGGSGQEVHLRFLSAAGQRALSG